LNEKALHLTKNQYYSHMTTNDISGTSMDIGGANREKLKMLFPSVFTETANEEGVVVESLDFERLKAELGTFTDLFEARKERYGFDWPGKKDSLKAIQSPTYATLKPCPEDSVNFETTENLFIEGDNLEVLKLLQKSYYGEVKMIYIDPPYNTGKDFIYPDNYSESLETYLSYAGLLTEDGKRVETRKNAVDDGRFHTKWINMMYPRLYMARNLLKQDGAIFVSIDENEHTRLRALMDEVFGQENFVADMVWAAGRKNDSRLISVSHEYIVCYARDKAFLTSEKIEWRQKKKGLSDIYSQYGKLKKQHGKDFAAMTVGMKAWFKGLADSDPAKAHKHFCHVDHRGLYFPDNISWPGGGGPTYEVLHPITKRPVTCPSRGWITPDPAKMQGWIDDDLVHFGKDETYVPCIKSYLKEKEFQTPYSVFYQDGRAATKRLRELMGATCFDFPKDEGVLQELVSMMTSDGDVIVDFFAGSGTTGHSVIEQNILDGLNRKFVLVQLPVPIDPSDKDQKEALEFCLSHGVPPNIAELSKERLRKVIARVAGRDGVNSENLGFRAFKLDKSNFKKWQRILPDTSAEKVIEQLELHIEHIEHGAKQSDLLYEVLIKAGYKPTAKVGSLNIAGETVYSVENGEMLICLAEKISKELVDAVIELSPPQFVCLDSAFSGNDQLKANAVQTFAAANQDKEKKNQILFRTI
jgi:adenine-specific DNA-methyltransferase